jgi:hypothetical protein
MVKMLYHMRHTLHADSGDKGARWLIEDKIERKMQVKMLFQNAMTLDFRDKRYKKSEARDKTRDKRQEIVEKTGRR